MGDGLIGHQAPLNTENPASMMLVAQGPKTRIRSGIDRL